MCRRQGFKTLAKLPGAGRSVWSQGNGSQIYDDFWEDRFIERAACDRKCRCGWG